MKKLLAVVIAGIMFSCVACFSGCFLDGCFSGNDGGSPDNSNNSTNNGGGASNSGNNNANSSSNYRFLIMYDEGAEKYTFTDYTSIKIEPKYKEGYVLNGFYLQRNGVGTQLLDFTGKSISSSWTKNFDHILYPYYEPIDYNYVFKSSIIREETPFSYSYNIYGNSQTCVWTINSSTLDYAYKVALSNPYIKINLIGTADFCKAPTAFSIGIGKDLKTGKLNQKSCPKTTNYTTQSISTEITGRAITNNVNNYIIVGLFCESFGQDGVAKNIYFQIRFIK